MFSFLNYFKCKWIIRMKMSKMRDFELCFCVCVCKLLHYFLLFFHSQNAADWISNFVDGCLKKYMRRLNWINEISRLRHDLVVKHVKISVFYVNVLFSFIGSVVWADFIVFVLVFEAFGSIDAKKCTWKPIAYDETISMDFEVKCPLKEQMVKNIWIGMCYWNEMKSTRLCYKERISIEFDGNWTIRDWNAVFWI